MATCTALTALELACQMDKMKVSLRKKDKQLLAASERVCEEFLAMNLPIHGEVLDLCAGASGGMVSATIQGKVGASFITIITTLIITTISLLKITTPRATSTWTLWTRTCRP